MGSTAIVCSKEEALSMEPSKRPLCYRVPSGIYHDTFESIGSASMSWTEIEKAGVFEAEKCERICVDLLFKIANTLEDAGVTYENWPDSWK